MAKEKFKPMAGHTYNLMFGKHERKEYGEPYYNPARTHEGKEYSQNWNYLVCVDSGNEIYWYVYSENVKNIIESMNCGQGTIVQMSVAEEMNEETKKAYRVYNFTKDGKIYSSRKPHPANQATPQEQSQQVPAKKSAQTDPTEELDKRKRLMKWCSITVVELAPDNFNTADKTNLIQSMYVELREKQIYPPEIKEENDNKDYPTEEEYNKTMPNQPPPPGEEDLPF